MYHAMSLISLITRCELQTSVYTGPSQAQHNLNSKQTNIPSTCTYSTQCINALTRLYSQIASLQTALLSDMLLRMSGINKYHLPRPKKPPTKFDRTGD